jgi:hypothetical protein
MFIVMAGGAFIVWALLIGGIQAAGMNRRRA